MNQFPPSSPLLSAHEDLNETDAFSLGVKPVPPQMPPKTHKLGDSLYQRTTQTGYPSPYPSSTAGRSSSPSRQVHSDALESDASSPIKHATSAKRDLYPPKIAISAFEKLKRVQFMSPAKQEVAPQLQAEPLPFEVLEPLAHVKRIPIPSVNESVTIGRSSKSCDYALNCDNKLISRSHLSLTTTETGIEVVCLGWNGISLTLPCKASVKFANGKQEDFEVITEHDVAFRDMARSGVSNVPRSVTAEGSSTSFFILRNERLKVPKMEGMIIDIRGESILLELSDEGETDEETSEELFKAIEPGTTEQPVVEIAKVPAPVAFTPEQANAAELLGLPMRGTPALPQVQAPATPTKSMAPPKSVEVAPTAAPVAVKTPVALQIPQATPTVLSTTIKTAAREEKQAVAAAAAAPPFEILRDATPAATERAESATDRGILARRDTNIPAQGTPETEKREALTDSPESAKRHRTEAESDLEHTLSKRSKSQEPASPDQVEEILASIKGLTNIENVLINHLAFSRLSSTPLSSLSAISHFTAKLSRRELRAVLASVACLGVIYRTGKDAAGKPLDEEYYYSPEHDDDGNRQMLVANSRGGKSLRSCRKTHKQYFWKKPAPAHKKY